MNGWSWPHRVNLDFKAKPPAAILLRQNVLLALSCFGFAVILWMYVAGADPEQGLARDTIREIQAPLEHSSSNTMNVVEPAVRTVTVTIRGATLWQSDHPSVRAWVDISKITVPGIHHLHVQVTSPHDPGLTVSVSPDEVDALVDTMATRDTHVVFSGIKDLPSGYAAQTPTIDPDVVSVTGPSSLLSRVKAIISFDLSNMTDNVDMLIPVHLAGVPDSYLHLFTIEPARVRLFLPIHRQLAYSTVPVSVHVRGEPAAGFAFGRAIASPSTVTISGAPSSILSLSEAPTAPVSLGGRTSDFSEQVALNLPRGVSIEGANRVRVRVQIMPRAAAPPAAQSPPTPAPAAGPAPAATAAGAGSQ